MPWRDHWRIGLLSAAVGMLALVIGLRLYQLQVVRCEAFRQRAQDQHQARLVVPATRGMVVDRHGEPLALSMESWSLFAHPRRVEDPRRAAKLLAPVIQVPQRELVARLRADKSFVYLRRFLEREVADRVRELDLPIGDAEPFGFEKEPKRVYPRDELAVHVVGYATIDGHGVEGVESRFDHVLKGDPLVYLLLQDARSGKQREQIGEPKKKPQDVVLSIDIVLQHLVERELDRAMHATRAAAASAVLLDPTSGQILALANRPAANPNQFGRATDRERMNRAVVSVYEPGSTFKIVPMAAALELGKIRASQRIYCEKGTYRTGPREIHDVIPHGMLTPQQILEKSSNIGMVKITQSLSADELRDAIAAFGFGAKTGIELPGESAGLLTDVSGWSGYSLASLAFGQEIGVTALQMTAALATIANDGVHVPPRIVLGTRSADGSFRALPAGTPRRVVGRATARQLGRMLESVVDGGTGRRAALAGYRAAGKSGTAQKAQDGSYSESDYVASFGGYAPVGAPRLVGLVVIDTPRGREHQGGQVAAPVFAQIMTEALRYLRVPTDDPRAPRTGATDDSLLASRVPFGAAEDRPSTAPGLVPDVIGLGLREAIAAFAARGCSTAVRGHGVVTAQRPAPDTPLQPGATCSLRLEPPDISPNRSAQRPDTMRRSAS